MISALIWPKQLNGMEFNMKKKWILGLALVSLMAGASQSEAACTEAYFAKARAMWPENNDLAMGAIGAGAVVTGYLGMAATFSAGLGPLGVIVPAAGMIPYLDKVERIGYFGVLIRDARHFKKSGADRFSQWEPVDSDPAMSIFTKRTRIKRLVNHIERDLGEAGVVRSYTANEFMEAIIAADDANAFCPRNEQGEVELAKTMSQFSKAVIRYLP